MSTIKLKCIDQALAFENTPLIASGGQVWDRVQVSFCSKWDGLHKTAVFWRNEKNAYHVLLDEDDSCAIPWEVLNDDGRIYIGFFGVNEDGAQHTSQVLGYNIVQGAITPDTAPRNPTADLYTQLLAKYVEMVEIAEDTRQQVAQDQAEFEQHIEEMIAAGLLPDNSVGTEKLKNGVITAEKMAPGTVYTQAETVTDETKGLFGLPAVALPNDIFKFLGGFNQHWWRRRNNNSHYEISFGTLKTVSVIRYSNTYGNWQTSLSVTYYDSAAVDTVSGAISVSGSHSVSISPSNPASANTLKGKYFKCNDNVAITPDDTLYYMPVDAADAVDGSHQYGYAVNVTASEVSAAYITDVTSWNYVRASDRNAYPDSGTSGDYEYAYVGVPFDNFVEPVAAGTYAGTDGETLTLTFPRNPKLLVIQANSPVSGNYWGAVIAGGTYGHATAAKTDGGVYVISVSLTDGTLIISGSYAPNLCKAGVLYHYTAIF